MKMINSVLSFLFGICFLYALITVVLKLQGGLTSLNWHSIESYGIILLLLVLGIYCLQNILVPFQKSVMKKRGRIIMITMHTIVLFIILIFSFNQYKYMNTINVIINILMITTIIYLTFYQITRLNQNQERD